MPWPIQKKHKPSQNDHHFDGCSKPSPCSHTVTMIKLLLGISNQQVPLNHHEIGEIPCFPKITIELPLNCRKNYHFSKKNTGTFRRGTSPLPPPPPRATCRSSHRRRRWRIAFFEGLEQWPKSCTLGIDSGRIKIPSGKHTKSY